MEKVIKLNGMLLQARKDKDEVAKNLLTTIKGEYEKSIKNGEKEGNDTLDAIIKKSVKDIKKTLEILDEIEQEERYRAFEKELTILEDFLPKMLTKEETENELNAFVSTCDASELNMGSIMKHFNQNFSGRVDRKLLSELAKETI